MYATSRVLCATFRLTPSLTSRFIHMLKANVQCIHLTTLPRFLEMIKLFENIIAIHFKIIVNTCFRYNKFYENFISCIKQA